MISAGLVLTSMPEKYQHTCSTCGAVANFTSAQLQEMQQEEKAAKIAQLDHRLNMMAEALLKVLQVDGVIRPDIESLTGPELVHLAESYCLSKTEAKGGIKLEPGKIVPRDDGRFYVPLSRVPGREGVSNIVARVASDAFEEPYMDAQLFAMELAYRWNKGA